MKLSWQGVVWWAITMGSVVAIVLLDPEGKKWILSAIAALGAAGPGILRRVAPALSNGETPASGETTKPG